MSADLPAHWRVRVSEEDVREAREAWLRARDSGAPPDRVAELLVELERVTRTAAEQSSGDAGAAERATPGPPVPARARRAVRSLRPAARRPVVG